MGGGMEGGGVGIRPLIFPGILQQITSICNPHEHVLSRGGATSSPSLRETMMDQRSWGYAAPPPGCGSAKSVEQSAGTFEIRHG